MLSASLSCTERPLAFDEPPAKRRRLNTAPILSEAWIKKLETNFTGPHVEYMEIHKENWKKLNEGKEIKQPEPKYLSLKDYTAVSIKQKKEFFLYSERFVQLNLQTNSNNNNQPAAQDEHPGYTKIYRNPYSPEYLVASDLSTKTLERTVEVMAKLAITVIVNLEDDHYFPCNPNDSISFNNQYTVRNMRTFPVEHYQNDFFLTKRHFLLNYPGSTSPHRFIEFHVTNWLKRKEFDKQDGGHVGIGWIERKTMDVGTWVDLASDINDYLKMNPLGGAILCNGGLGKSGTFMAIREIVHHYVSGDMIDEDEVLLKLRRQKSGLVQTLEQYCEILKTESCLIEREEDTDIESSQ